jgi:Mg2+-importing ATPase
MERHAMESGTARQVDQAQSAFWKQSGSDIAGNGSEWRAGLSSLEAERRTKLHGPNVIVTDTNSHVIVKLVRRFLQPLVLVLLVASVISGLSGDLASSMIILIIVGVSTGLDVVQEQGAERAAAALRQSIAIWVEALRDGEPADIPVEQLVPGTWSDWAPVILCPPTVSC